MTTDDPDTWRPGDILQPGHPCPPHLRQQIAEGIAEGLARLRGELDQIRDKAERKDAK